MPGTGDEALNDERELDVSLLKRVIAVQTGVARLGVDFEAIATLVAREILGMTSADAAIVEMLEGDELVYLAASGSAASSVGLRLSLATSLSGVCVTQARTLYCEDAHSDPRVDREACDRVGLRSMVVAPLFHRGAAVGVLKILSSRPSAFGWRDRKVLTYMAEVIAASIHTASRYAEDALFRKATRDHLTGLANRALFHDRLEHGLEQAARHGDHLGLVYVDMDELKALNDRHGHQAGDIALRTLGARLVSCARRSDTVARLGGDEFAVVLSPLQDRSAGEEVVARMQASLEERMLIGGEPRRLRASFGLALYPEDGISPDQLLEAADRAMYRAKRKRVRESQ
ncbi:diguanylate cyclase domain-containing protein [Haliea atlantica]